MLIPQRYNFSSKSQPELGFPAGIPGCCWYHKGTIFQANHNKNLITLWGFKVVVDTTKVQFFKQITTRARDVETADSCCWYHKGTIFQANHNVHAESSLQKLVVVDTTKVQFFKQITTIIAYWTFTSKLLLIPQRYNFSSKSQLLRNDNYTVCGCCWYHKGTIFQANHNYREVTYI